MEKFEPQPNLEAERLERFQRLREEVHQEMEREVEGRIKENPVPTEEEIRVGGFREVLEPQVRDALFEFNRKGYSTESSGFGGEHGEIQAIDGYFRVDEQTKAEIERLGAKVLKGKDIGMPGFGEDYTFIQFRPDQPDLDEIKNVWDRIADALPDKGQLALPSISGGSDEFRKKFAPERTDIEKLVLRKSIDTGEMSPETAKEMEKRLRELSE